MRKYVYCNLIAADQLFNAAIGGAPDETLSSRIYRNACLKPHPRRRWSMALKVVNALFFWQKNHCLGAYVSEVSRRHLPPEFSNR